MSDTAERKRELGFSERMSEHEALMWNVEKDPWLNPSGAALVVFDKPIDVEEFRRRMRHAVSELPRLYQRVSPGFGRISTPAWAPDPEFELDFHFRTTTLPPPGTERQLFDLGARLYQEPFDRTRPLWRLVVIDGLESGEGALWMITHHAVSDGIGQLRMAEMYQDLSPDVPPAPEVDLEGIIAEAVAEHRLKEEGGDLATSLRSTVTRSASHLVRRQVGIARRVAGELVLWPADPKRIGDRAADITAAARGTIGPLAKSATESDTGSPLWRQRSRHRHLEHVRIPLDSLKAAAKRHDASVNDAFMAGMVEAAARYHAQRGVSVDTFNTSFVLSTRSDSAAGGNAFTPVQVQLSGREMPLDERLVDVRDRIARARDDAARGGGITALSGVVNLFPTSMVTRLARSQAGKIDFATSNLRGASFPLYVAGARVLRTITMGPLAGTPCNATALSYENAFDIGLFIDPEAIEDPADFRRCVETAFGDLLDDTPGSG